MAERGELFGEGPLACPFVALELDRDRRADRPDYRHRCFAEPTPAPRAIAHQEAYCLSPNFAACPVFRGWAMRAAARPVPVPDGYAGTDVAPAAAPAPAVADAEPVIPAADESWPAGAFAAAAGDEPESPEQLGVFDARAEIAQPPSMDVRYQRPRAPAPPDDWVAGGESAPIEHAQPDDAPVPAFLTGREPLGPRSSRVGTQQPERVMREDLVPSWEIDGRYGAQAGDDGRGDRFGGLVTAVAVIAILALGVAGVIFLPGLLPGGGPARTSAPSTIPSTQPSVLPSASGSAITSNPPSASASASATARATSQPTATPGPVATPRLYRIKPGDSLMRIARRFDVTVGDILAFNPQIVDADHIEVGQVIQIPPPAGSLPTAAP